MWFGVSGVWENTEKNTVLVRKEKSTRPNIEKVILEERCLPDTISVKSARRLQRDICKQINILRTERELNLIQYGLRNKRPAMMPRWLCAEVIYREGSVNISIFGIVMGEWKCITIIMIDLLRLDGYVADITSLLTRELFPNSHLHS